MKKLNFKKTSMMLAACAAFAFMAASCANEAEKKIVGDWEVEDSESIEIDEYTTADATITMNTTFKDDKTYTYEGEMTIDIPLDGYLEENEYISPADFYDLGIEFPTSIQFVCEFKGDGKWSATKDELKIESGKFETEANWDSDGDDEIAQTIIDESGLSQSDFEEIVKAFPLTDNGTIKIKKLTDSILTFEGEDGTEMEFSKK
ncbi:MAG TPA: hypothetical protein IAD18_04010 [Candidatus Limisoma intestinavium]|uniref:Lipocalin-like domain-containing protein n=1 Tax=Candidatus Limisoma intestinavium TaxID=2840856 RepID=A0A9D1LGF4_9BACT|nr:hypothetical protein [Candidatus Limisoma intestinavium]